MQGKNKVTLILVERGLHWVNVFSNGAKKILDRSSFRRCSIKSCSWKFCNIPRKAPALESLFNEVAGLKTCSFVKKGLLRKCFPVNIAKFLWTPFFKNICELLLLTGAGTGGAKVYKDVCSAICARNLDKWFVWLLRRAVAERKGKHW